MDLTKHLSDFLGRESSLRSSDHGSDALTIRPSKLSYHYYYRDAYIAQALEKRRETEALRRAEEGLLGELRQEVGKISAMIRSPSDAAGCSKEVLALLTSVSERRLRAAAAPMSGLDSIRDIAAIFWPEASIGNIQDMGKVARTLIRQNEAMDRCLVGLIHFIITRPDKNE